MSRSIAEIEAELDNQVVGKHGYTRKQLKHVFDQVCNPADWKGPISAVMTGECVIAAVEAIEFFTATKAEVNLNVETMLYHVSSIGYRMGPAGDH